MAEAVEVCRVVDTLLIDQEMVYTPRQSNDRLLLGLNRPETQSTPNSTFYWTTDPGVSGSERGFRLPKPSLRQIYPTC